jgi:hypothetical protein
MTTGPSLRDGAAFRARGSGSVLAVSLAASRLMAEGAATPEGEPLVVYPATVTVLTVAVTAPSGVSYSRCALRSREAR